MIGGHVVGMIVAVVIAIIVLGPKEFRELGPALNKGIQDAWTTFNEARDRNLSREDLSKDFWPPAA